MKKAEIKNVKPLLQQHNVSSSFVFDPALLDKLKGDAPTYSIGVDTYDEKSLAYCFCKLLDGKVEILLAKTMRSKKDFKEEVSNLSKYFNAKICGEVD
jgi:hypothetical protein